MIKLKDFYLMRTMDDFTIHCTEAQTEKALKIGAPIKMITFARPMDGQEIVILDGDFYKIPTAEQMISWLEEKGIFISIQRIKECGGTYSYYYTIEHNEHGYLTNGLWTFDSRPEAALAAIDAALEYLSNNRK